MTEQDPSKMKKTPQSASAESPLILLSRPLTTQRKTPDVQRLVVAFGSLQRNLQMLTLEEGVEQEILQAHVEMLDLDRQRIEAALNEKRDQEAWGFFDDAWLRFAQIVPARRFALLLSQRVYSRHTGTGTQTLVGYYDLLREEAAMLAYHPDVNSHELRSYVLILEATRPKLEQALAQKHFDHAWFLVRGLWELRLGILPAERLEAERKGLELLTPSVGRGKRRTKLEKALKDAGKETDLARLRGLLIWIKREINESAQTRYWRFNIYERRVKMTASLLVGLVLLLSAMTVILSAQSSDQWGYQIAATLAVLMAGSLGGAVSGLRTSEEISQQRISSAYFKQAVTRLRMLVGAAAALVVYLLLASGLLAVTFGSGTRELVYVALGFAAGFSERFFLQALDQATIGSGIIKKEAPQAQTTTSSEAGASLAGTPGKESPEAQDEPTAVTPSSTETAESVGSAGNEHRPPDDTDTEETN